MEDLYKWQAEYWQKAACAKMNEVPLPIMVGGKPFWRGVNPPKGIVIPDGCIYVADFNCKIWRVLFKNTRPPNDEEYDLYFRKDMDKNTYFLKMRKNDDFMIVLEKMSKSRKKNK